MEAAPFVKLVDQETQTSEPMITDAPPTIQDSLAPLGETLAKEQTSDKPDSKFDVGIDPTTGQKIKPPNKGSTRPPHIWPKLWSSFGPSSRQKSIDEYNEYLERSRAERLRKEAAEKGAKTETTGSPSSSSTPTSTSTSTVTPTTKPQKGRSHSTGYERQWQTYTPTHSHRVLYFDRQ